MVRAKLSKTVWYRHRVSGMAVVARVYRTSGDRRVRWTQVPDHSPSCDALHSSSDLMSCVYAITSASCHPQGLLCSATKMCRLSEKTTPRLEVRFPLECWAFSTGGERKLRRRNETALCRKTRILHALKAGQSYATAGAAALEDMEQRPVVAGSRLQQPPPCATTRAINNLPRRIYGGVRRRYQDV